MDWLIPESTRRGLAVLDTLLEQTARSGSASLDPIALHLLALGGKRLRPALVMLAAGEAVVSRPVLIAAASVELLHLASLHHDDVIDRAPRRRSGRSVNARWGNELATLTGSYLFARAGTLIAGLGEEAVSVFGAAAARLALGELRETENVYNVGLSPEQHLDILRHKTASLFELAVELGCLFSHAGRDRRADYLEYGRHLGLAFQLCDDLLDLTGSSEVLGKDSLQDIRRGVYSLPLLLTFARHDDRGREARSIAMREHPTVVEGQRLLELARAVGAVDHVRSMAEGHAKAAKRVLHSLPPTPATRALERLAVLAVCRDF